MKTTQRDIIKFNDQLNNYDYGIIVDERKFTDNIDVTKYTTISPDIFKKYKCGTCWDYTEYEAKFFEEQFHFKFTNKPLDHDGEFSIYYMQIDDGNKIPTHTWLAYRNNGKIYLFESAWKQQIGITKYNTEEEMVKDYIKKFRKYLGDNYNPIIVTKYKRNKKFKLTPEEFMTNCIDNGKVIYSGFNCFPIQELCHMI